MRQTFHLLRSADDRAEEHRSLRLLAERLHQLRAFRSIHVRYISDLQGHRPNDGAPALTGPCTQIRVGDDQEELIGYAFFPETVAYAGVKGAALLLDQLHELKPDMQRHRDAEIIEFPKSNGKAA